jgi:hypothetical protein
VASPAEEEGPLLIHTLVSSPNGLPKSPWASSAAVPGRGGWAPPPRRGLVIARAPAACRGAVVVAGASTVVAVRGPLGQGGKGGKGGGEVMVGLEAV